MLSFNNILKRDCEPTTDQPPALPKAYQPISSKHLLMSYSSIIVMFQGTCRGLVKIYWGGGGKQQQQCRKGRKKIMQILRLSPPDLKMQKNQLSPFPLLHQPAKEFRRCSLEKKSNSILSIKRQNQHQRFRGETCNH